MSKLHLATGLDLPVDVTTQKNAFLGRTGSGKTYGATKLAELLLQHDAQVVVLDPVGVWYGLRIGADGKPGFKIPVFGGLHGDVPLLDTAGAQLADLIVDRGISAVLDVSQFETDTAKARFASAFAERFFFRKKAAPAPVHLFLEECQEFVPQNPQAGDAQMLHAFTRMAKLGRNFGIGISLISQRPQEINKKVLNMTEVMFAFQMRGPQERKTIREWSSDKDLSVDVESELPGLQVGEAFVSSPQWLQVEKKVKIAKKVTADVSSTPKVGEASRAARPLTPIDLEELRHSMASTIEQAKDADPKELKKRIRELEADNRRLTGTGAKPGVIAGPVIEQHIATAVEKAVADERRRQDRQRRVFQTSLRTAIARIQRGQHELTVGVGMLQGIDQEIDQNWMPAPAADPGAAALPAAPARRVEYSRPPARASRNTDGTSIGGTPQRMLNALKFLESIGVTPATRKQVAGLVGVSADTGSFRTYLSELRGPGYIDDHSDGRLALTDAGREQASDDGLPTRLAELHETYLRRLGGTPAKMLRILIDAYPDAMDRAALGAMLSIDSGTGSFRTYLSELRSPGLIEDPSKTEVKASDLLFPPGLK